MQVSLLPLQCSFHYITLGLFPLQQFWILRAIAEEVSKGKPEHGYQSLQNPHGMGALQNRGILALWRDCWGSGTSVPRHVPREGPEAAEAMGREGGSVRLSQRGEWGGTAWRMESDPSKVSCVHTGAKTDGVRPRLRKVGGA